MATIVLFCRLNIAQIQNVEPILLDAILIKNRHDIDGSLLRSRDAADILIRQGQTYHGSNPTVTQQCSWASDMILRHGRAIRQRDNDGALLEFRRAYSLNPTHGQDSLSPPILVDIGFVEEAMGLHYDAVKDLTAARDAWNARNYPWMRQNWVWFTGEIERITRTTLGRIEVVDFSNVQGAELWVKGVFSARLPMLNPILAPDTGDVFIEVKAPGYETVSDYVKVFPGRLTRKVIRLTPVSDAGTDRQVSDAGMASDAGSDVVPPPVDAGTGGQVPVPQDAGTIQPGPWGPISIGLMIGGGVSILVAGGAYGLYVDKSFAWNNDPACTTHNPPTEMSCRNWENERGTAMDVSIVAGILGGVMAATGMAIWSMQPNASRTTRRLTFSCNPSFRVIGMSCMVPF